jgi:hypothetical protein
MRPTMVNLLTLLLLAAATLARRYLAPLIRPT